MSLEAVTQHRRLCILRMLTGANRYTLNDSVIYGLLADVYGLGCSRDEVRGQLAWLAEQQLLTLQAPAANVLIATLSERGLDVASGRTIYPGVQRPSPTSLAREALRVAAGLPPEE